VIEMAELPAPRKPEPIENRSRGKEELPAEADYLPFSLFERREPLSRRRQCHSSTAPRSALLRRIISQHKDKSSIRGYSISVERNHNGAAMRRLAIILIVASFVPVRAFAWGTEGHRIIAEIAELHLEPEAARQIRDLLAIENETALADVANWADQIRRQRPQTAPWHFVDIPITASGYDARRDCAAGNCVVAKIEEFTAELQNRSLPPRERLEALKFVVHFVGDLHQPLHASDNDDRGGNDVRVEFLGRRTNLHAVWDTAILAPAVNGDERSYALGLDRQITPGDTASWQSGTPEQWANESHAIAVTTIYRDLSYGGTLPERYEDEALPIVNLQLEKAGIRLAGILNTMFDPGSP
jgi:hypothetical protein